MNSIQAGAIWPIEILITAGEGGEPITGLSSGDIVCSIRCTTPGGADYNKQWDFGGVTPQLRASGWTTRQAPLVEVSASLAPGWYAVAAGWPTTGLTGSYVLTYDLTSAVDTTSVPATDDVLVLAAGGAAASTSDVTAARDVITTRLAGIEGAGFTTGADDMRQQSIRTSSTDTKVSLLQTHLGVLNTFTILTGTTSTVIKTNCAYPTGTWDGQELLTFDPNDAARPVARRIVSQIGGDFTIAAVPWTPDVGDLVGVRPCVSPSTTADLATSQTAITTAVAGSTTAVNLHTDGVAAALPGATNTALGASHGTGSWASATGFATPTNVSDAVAAIEAYGQLHWTTAVVAGLSTITTGDIGPAVWNALTAAHATANSFGALFKLNLNATITSRMATFTYVDPPSAQDISTIVNADIEAAHGAGAYTTAVISTLATTAQLNTAVTTLSTAITAVPTAVWSRALPGSHLTGSAGALLALAGALAPPSAADIAAAWRDLPEGTPTIGSYGYAVQLGRMLLTNRLDETAGNPGTAILYKDNGTTPHKTWALRDKDGLAITATAGEPARRGAAT